MVNEPSGNVGLQIETPGVLDLSKLNNCLDLASALYVHIILQSVAVLER